MRDNITAKRYADAFVEFAGPRIGMERCVAEIKSLKWLLRENPQLERILKAPDVPASEKFRLIDKVCAVQYSKELCVFLKHLITKWRIARISDIADYIREVYSQGESVAVTLRTTFPLELVLIERVKERLQKKIGRSVNLYLELDPDLLGGIQILVGNTIIDGSVRGKLQELKKQLLKT
ncbi:MAG: ATP synthase F1 subunit delta [Candidatus Omnitrophica bacterium]|nr:ATP synthase F1 subunit delta [Candidatus Omnitrophota bacterium]